MDKAFFERKVKSLTDEKLIELVKLGNDGNKEIIDLALDEVNKRNIQVDLSDGRSGVIQDDFVQYDQLDLIKLEEWNWGAFSFSIIWSYKFKLYPLTIASLIFGPSLLAKIYLGEKGNLMAFKKSNMKSVDDFLSLQEKWNSWGKRYFWFWMVIIILALLYFLVDGYKIIKP